MAYVLLVTTCTCLILSIQLYKCCTFDQIQIDSINLPQVDVPYNQFANRQSRSATSRFLPIRIHVHYSNQSELSSEETQRLQTIVSAAVNKISSLLKVIPVVAPLLLERKEACKWKIPVSGPNSQKKCLQIKPNYSGEYCFNKVDRFKIPENHLSGLNVYSMNDPLPLASSFPNGTGIKDTDFILYINSRFSSWCQEQNLIAYASYCQLDQNDRPIAGFVNFCPIHLSTIYYSKLAATMTAVHEIFHALGFSHDLFSKYKDCQYSTITGRQCHPQRESYQRDVEGGDARIILPSVIREANQHFGCDQDLGVPLEKSEYGLSSHWDPLIMHNSIMAPSFKQYQEVSIDPITLSVFADSGWYQVNYSAVDAYSWAKDAGCGFLQSFQCSRYHFLCNISLINEFGCTMSSQGIAECLPVSDKHPCGVFKQNEKLCCRTHNYNITSLSTPQSRVILSEGPTHDDNVTLVVISLAWPTPKEVSLLGLNISHLHHLALQKLLIHVCPVNHLLINSSLQVLHSNDSYSLYLWLKKDQGTNDEATKGIFDRLQFLTRYGNFTLDLDLLEIQSPAAVPSRSKGRVSFLRGWEVIVVLAGVTTACLFLALLISTFIQLKSRIWHQMRSTA